ncbi:MAG: ABC transporter ATP-binding protein [Candidatus Marinimicrobia bacterium]|nr:ABC transporter ATP-binding protein [Candidatus Neomarinimicrobiota bacterium]MDD5582740.1 ABC transporter ATP-binding protein [Candidatus Neomarinimicrobiota bacterium]
MSEEHILHAYGITKTYQSGSEILLILKDVALKLYPGDFVSLMGASGSGKSTFLNILGTMDSPDQGHVIIHGTDTVVLKESQLADFRRKHIGFVFQFHYLLPEFTVGENVAMPLLIAGYSRSKAMESALELMDYLGIVERKDHFPSEISGGEKQRVAICRALIAKPDIIFADEPTGNLDRETGSHVLDLFKKINRDFNQSFFLVTHDESIAAIATRQYLLKDATLFKVDLESGHKE